MLLFITTIALLFGSSFSWGALKASLFKCPTSPITPNLFGNGTIPTNATGPIRAPAGANCLITFHVPDGYALKVESKGMGVNGSDVFELIDTVGKRYHSFNNKTNILWLTRGNSSLKIQSRNGTLSFFVKYQYQLLNQLASKPVREGSHFTPKQGIIYNLVASPNKKNLAISIAHNPQNTTEPVGKDIYVYAGGYMLTATMIGRLADLMGNKDSFYTNGTAISLVNFYETGKSEATIMVNDASAVANLTSYSVVTVDDKVSLRKTLLPGSACTFVASKNFTLSLKSLSISTKNGSILLQEQTPTQRLNRTSLNLKTKFPRKIATNTFTVYAVGGNVTLTVEKSKTQNSTKTVTKTTKLTGSTQRTSKFNAFSTNTLPLKNQKKRKPNSAASEGFLISIVLIFFAYFI